MAKFPDGYVIFVHTKPRFEDGGITIDICCEDKELVTCKNCRHFCIKDHFGNFNGVPILGASDVPTCDAWANTECMVKPDGYCFMAERREGERREL